MADEQVSKDFRLYSSFYELNKQQSGTLFINALENAIDSLETGLTFFKREDSLRWKWIAISLHHALYSFCVTCLVGGNYDYVIALSRDEDDNRFCLFGRDTKWKRSKRQFRPDSPGYTIIWTETDEDPTKASNKQPPKQTSQQLISFWTALASVQDSYFWMGRYDHTEALLLTEEEWRAIEWLTLEARNRIVHFIPVSRSYPVDRFKEVSIHVTRAIEFLALESKAITYIHRREDKQRISESITQIRSLLAN